MCLPAVSRWLLRTALGPTPLEPSMGSEVSVLSGGVAPATGPAGGRS